MMRTRYLCGLLILALGVLLTVPAMARPRPGGKAQIKAKQTAKEIRQRVRRMRAKVLRVQVGLDDATADKAEKILDSFERAHRDKQRAVRQARRKLQRLFAEDSEDEQAYQQTLAQLHQAHKDIQQLREKQLTALSKVLTYKQQAKLMRSLSKLRRKAARLRQKQRQKRSMSPQPKRRR